MPTIYFFIFNHLRLYILKSSPVCPSLYGCLGAFFVSTSLSLSLSLSLCLSLSLFLSLTHSLSLSLSLSLYMYVSLILYTNLSLSLSLFLFIYCSSFFLPRHLSLSITLISTSTLFMRDFPCLPTSLLSVSKLHSVHHLFKIFFWLFLCFDTK